MVRLWIETPANFAGVGMNVEQKNKTLNRTLQHECCSIILKNIRECSLPKKLSRRDNQKRYLRGELYQPPQHVRELLECYLRPSFRCILGITSWDPLGNGCLPEFC